MYYADLTAYEYSDIARLAGKVEHWSKLGLPVDSDRRIYSLLLGADKVLNVGWLARGYPYPKGDVPRDFVRRLYEIGGGFNTTRGYHECDFVPTVKCTAATERSWFRGRDGLYI